MNISTVKNKKQQIKGSKDDRLFDIFNMAFWVFFLILIMYPLYLVVIASVSDPDAVLAGEVLIVPVDFSWIGYEAVFGYSDLWNSYLNSIIYTVIGTSISVIVTLMAAYSTTRKFVGKGAVLFIFVFTMFFNGGLIPTFITLRDVGLYNTRAVFILFNAVSVWNLMVARTYIQATIPNELFEAASMDGMGHFGYFLKVVLPLSGTIVAVLAVYYGVAKWNDYFTGLIYLRDRVKLPLQTILREILAILQGSTSSEQFFSSYADDIQGMTEAIRKAEVAKYCTIVLSTGPAVILYVFMQKYFVKGVMIGSLKG